MSYLFVLRKCDDEILIAVKVAQPQLAKEIKACFETLKENGWAMVAIEPKGNNEISDDII